MTEQTRRAKPLPSSVEPKTLGAVLWREITRKYDLRLDELEVLEQAAVARNRIAEIAGAWRADGRFVVKGSTGQDVSHPLLAEERFQRQLYARLLGSLKLPDEAGAVANGRKAASAAGRSLALRRHGASG